MLGLDEVGKTTVESTLKEVTDIVARFEFAGQVEGTIYGVSTAIEIKGKYRFDLRSHRIDWLAMLVKEDRPASFVADGVDVVSRLQMIVTPAQEPASFGRRRPGQAGPNAHGGTALFDLPVACRRLAVSV